LFLILAVNCGKDDPLPGPPDAAAKDGGSDAVKGDGGTSGDASPVSDAGTPDVVPVVLDSGALDATNLGDTPVAPVGPDASISDTSPVRLDTGLDQRDGNLADLSILQADTRPDSPTQDAPAADAPGSDSGAEG
jgi:hypothetical protein